MTDTTRRAVVFGAGGAGLAVALSACAGYSSGSSAAPAGDDAAAGDAAASGAAPKKAAEGGGDAVAKTADIPQGGGKILEDQKIVITQPEAGTFKAFSAVCTHAGCTVASVSNGTINCPCHGSKFSAKDGSVAHGPASRPLAEQKITVTGDSITLG